MSLICRDNQARLHFYWINAMSFASADDCRENLCLRKRGIGTMKSCKIIFSIIILFTVSFFCSFSYADIGHYTIPPQASIPFPEKNNYICLETVSVTINADKIGNKIKAQCVFDFKNLSDKSQSVIMGFPIVTLKGLGISGLDNFEVKTGLKEQKTLFICKNVSEYEMFPTNYDIIVESEKNEAFNIYPHPEGKDKEKTVFGGEYTTKIFWKYTFSPKQHQRFYIEYQANDWRNITYIIDTAASWQGEVKNMTIKIIYPIKIPFHYLYIYPSGCKYEANQLVWNFKDYNISMGTQISANIIVVIEESDGLPKYFFTDRTVENVEYKLDKQYFHYYIDANREDDPNNSTKAIKSLEYALNEVAFIRNEIYARKGYIFKDPKYQNYFLKKTWYKPNPKFSFSEINYIEKRNASYLKCVEEAIANFPQEFKKYFKVPHLFEGKLVYYCWDGEGCSFLDEEYFSLEDKYISSVESCYGKHLP